ncbi:MAG TPA: amidase [Gammaproteobacteria bacterium]|nr:amidase [Gammaproteobacteria bacterium]
MAISRPTLEEIKNIADRFNLGLSGDDLKEYWHFACEAVDGYAEMDTMADARLPVRYPRQDVGYRPVGDDNPVNGWSWKCRIDGAADGLLKGKTVAIKDNTAVAGLPMLNGSALMEGYVPDEDATVVTRLLDAGATIVGKTNVPGFCVDGGGVTGYPEPQPINPHGADYLPGASSNGSGVVVANGEVDIATGGDQGGSIRLPASWSGCCGLKPTYGLVPYTGVFPIELTIDHTGPMARTVEDCARALQAMAGPDGMDPRQPANLEPGDYMGALGGDVKGLRIGLLREGFAIPGASEKEVDEAVRAAVAELEAAGASATEVSAPLHKTGVMLWNAIAFEGATAQMVVGDGYGVNWKGYYSTGLMDFYGRARKARGRDFSATTKVSILVGTYMSEVHNHHYYAKAQNTGRMLRAEYDAALEQVDVLVMPTTPMVARRKPRGTGLSDIFSGALGNLQNTAAFDISGHPAMSIPCGDKGGLPIGMMIVGRHFEEETVLKVAHAYEAR